MVYTTCGENIAAAMHNCLYENLSVVCVMNKLFLVNALLLFKVLVIQD